MRGSCLESGAELSLRLALRAGRGRIASTDAIRVRGLSTSPSLTLFAEAAPHGAFIRNVGEAPWREFRNHSGGALSKPLVMPETSASRRIDYRISMYQPMAPVARRKHNVREQSVTMEVGNDKHVVEPRLVSLHVQEGSDWNIRLMRGNYPCRYSRKGCSLMPSALSTSRTFGSCPVAWCSSVRVTAFAGMGRIGQLAIAGKLTAGSSPNGAIVSSVM